MITNFPEYLECWAPSWISKDGVRTKQDCTKGEKDKEP
jgi:hypothetical protein